MLLRQRSEVATLKAELEAYAGRVQTGDGGSTAASLSSNVMTTISRKPGVPRVRRTLCAC